MDFKQLVMHDVDEKYREMASGTTDQPLSKTPMVISNSTYEKKRNTYYKRLDSEKIDFNKAIVKIKNAQTTRLRDEEKKREEKERKRANRRVATKKFAKVFLTLVIVVGALSALIGFVIWPKMIYPNMEADSLFTPEILRTYYRDSTSECYIITFTDCSEDGKVSAIWESCPGSYYHNNEMICKLNLTGQITEKKNNGSLVIEWTSKELICGWNSLDGDASYEDGMKITVKNNNYNTFETGFYDTYITEINEKYAVSTREDLEKLIDSDGIYYLTNDIDLSGKNWTPIDGFEGILVGNGYTISNMTIKSSTSNVGFFSKLYGFVMDVNFINANIYVSGNNKNIGILCGEMEGNAMGISVAGEVSAPSSNNVGGIIGYKYSGELSCGDLYSSAMVCGQNHVGGVWGYLHYDSLWHRENIIQLNRFTNSGKVIGSGDNVGGVIGCISADRILHINDFKNSGEVNGNANVGGVIGYVYSGGEGSYVQNSTSTTGTIVGNAVNIEIRK